MFERILVPTDRSDCADVAVEYAADLAAKFQASIHPFHVIDSRYLETAPPYDAILDEGKRLVESNDIDLVLMGTHGHSEIESYLLGSVAEKTVRTSPVPVSTVPQPE